MTVVESNGQPTGARVSARVCRRSNRFRWPLPRITQAIDAQRMPQTAGLRTPADMRIGHL